jgi:hypothetical protein
MTKIEIIERQLEQTNKPKRAYSLAGYSKEFKDHVAEEKSDREAKSLKRLAMISTIAAIVSTIAAVIALLK